MSEFETVRSGGARMERYVTVLAVASLLLVVLERFSASTIALVRHGFAAPAWLAWGCEAVRAVPELAFVLAVWWVRAALRSFARGELFGRPITTMLDRVGVTLTLGAAARIVLVPGACRLLGQNPGYWIAFDPASLALCAVGLALTAIASALRHASSIAAELDEIF